jgi:peptide/nickel transport system ATP-binding protein
MLDEPLLRVENLCLHFRTTAGIVQAVDGVDLDLGYNEAIVVLGESGCGKTSLARAILRLLPRNVHTYSGQVYLESKELMGLDDEEFRRNVRWIQMSLVPQAAMNALNPVLKEGFMDRYAFELSGGMRQRVAIAMSLVTAPKLIVLDEPTSALDVLTQANIFNVLKRIKQELQVSFVLITHDIATSSELADRVAVMYAGEIVEVNSAASFFAEPLHPYSQKLMASVPRLRGDQEPDFITGQPPSLLAPPTSCRFAARCPSRFERCEEDPPMIGQNRTKVKCWLHA